MTFTYDDTSVTTTRDMVRTLIGDTDSNYPVFTDEEIDQFIAQSDDEHYVAGMCMMAIASSQARIANLQRVGEGDFTIDRKAVAKECREQAKAFFARAESIPQAKEVFLEDKTITDIDAMLPSKYNRDTRDSELNV